MLTQRVLTFLGCTKKYKLSSSIAQRILFECFVNEVSEYHSSIINEKRRIVFLACIRKYRVCKDIKKVLLHEWGIIEALDFLTQLVEIYNFGLRCSSLPLQFETKLPNIRQLLIRIVEELCDK